MSFHIILSFYEEIIMKYLIIMSKQSKFYSSRNVRICNYFFHKKMFQWELFLQVLNCSPNRNTCYILANSITDSHVFWKIIYFLDFKKYFQE